MMCEMMLLDVWRVHIADASIFSKIALHLYDR